MVAKCDELVTVSDLEREHDTGKGVLRTILFDHAAENDLTYLIANRTVVVTRATADWLVRRYAEQRHRHYRGSPGKRPGRRPKTLADRGD